MTSAPSTLVNVSTTDFRESRHDIEMQSPMQGSFIVDEKEPFASPSRSRSTYVVQSPLTPISPATFPRLNQPTRKYSSQWWNSYWDRAVAVGLLPRLLYGGIGLLILGLWVGLTFYFASTEIIWADKLEHSFADHVHHVHNNTHHQDYTTVPSISLEGLLKNFDTVTRQLTIEWSGLWQDHDKPKMEPIPLGNGTFPNIPTPIEIYTDTATTVWIWGDRYEVAEDDSSNLYFKLYNASTHPTAVIGLTPDDSFSTQISFKQAADRNDLTRLPLYAYPYDQWEGGISFIANNRLYDKYWGLNKSSVFPLIGARLRDHTINWRFDMTVTNDCEYWKPSEVLIASQTWDMPSSEWTNSTLEDIVVPCRMVSPLFSQNFLPLMPDL
ncbi:hypothetical protein CPB86DRAFT_819304 [Serendipita vermifera]|nr:hypothetical protein CPB86DRAFT_819304 [Serendipita vermifera]